MINSEKSDKLRIVVDGRLLESAEKENLYRTGVFHATVGLLRALHEREDVELNVVGCRKCSSAFINNVLCLPEYVFFPLLPERRPTVFLSTFLAIDKSITLNPLVVPYQMVHDIWAHSLNLRESTAFDFEENLVRSITPRTAIAAVSQATRNDLRKFFNVPHEQITVIYEGVRPDWCDKEELVIKRPEIAGLPPAARYVLCLSTLEPRKNLATSLRAFERLVALENATEASYTNPIYLVIAGANGWGNQNDLIQGLTAKAQARTIVAGYLSDDALKNVIQGAECLMHPALYEGFGLPVLEAQHFGVPVIASNRGALQEVAGVAGILLDPMDYEGFAIATYRLLSDKDYRNKISVLGRIQSKQFSYARSADSLINHPFMQSQLKVIKSLTL